MLSRIRSLWRNLVHRGAVDRDLDDEMAALSHPFWLRRFNKDPGVVGRTFLLNRHPFIVVGIAPEGFQGTGVRAPDVWVPITMIAAATSQGFGVLSNRAAGWLLLGGRLRPGVDRMQAAAEIEAIGQGLAREHPQTNGNAGLTVSALSPVPGSRRPIAAFLLLLTVLVGVVLTIACANISGVLLARSVARRRELAVRTALGAARARLIRQMLVETMLLFVAGGGVALLVAGGMRAALVSILPALPFPVALPLGVDAVVLAFTSAITVGAAVLCGLAPALQGSKVDVIATLKADAVAPRRLRLRHAFVMIQVALSIVLIVVAGLFARALIRAGTTDPGFDPSGVEVASLDLRLAGYDDQSGPAAARDLIARVRRLPGVESATLAAVLPGGFEGIGVGSVRVPAGAALDRDRVVFPDWNVVEPAYFTTLRLPLVGGRDFTDADRKGAQQVAIVGEALARRFWPAADPVGQSLILPRGGADVVLQVIGVARDPRHGSLIDGTSGLYVYLPLQQEYIAGATMLVWRSRTGERITADIRSAVAASIPGLPPITSQTAADYTSLGVIPQWMGAYVAGSLGVVGLLLAAIGIYGVTAYMVAQRTREIGIRVALGAQRSDIVRMVLRNGMFLVGIGCAVGLLLAAAVSQLLGGLLFGIRPLDPMVFGAASILFVGAGLLASYLPCRNAVRVEAQQAFRSE